MKYFIISGEASGDLHGSNLIKGLMNKDKEAEICCYGGDKMKSAGAYLLKHYNEMAFMGIWEVVKNLNRVKKNFRDCERDIMDFSPNVIILIDYAGFNLRIAKFARKHKYKVHYYISPKLWAWGKHRVKKIKTYVNKMFTILPFEVEFYKKYGIKAEFYGNPLIDEIYEFKDSYCETKEEFFKNNNLENKKIIALLAGSRKQEIDHCLPEMINASKSFSEFQFVLAGAPSLDKKYYNHFLRSTNIKLVYNKTYELLHYSYAAVVTSGTATLETALFNVPQVAIYKTSSITYFIGQFFVLLGVIHVKFFVLVNIILNRLLVKELLQFNLSKKIADELNKILNIPDYRRNVLDGYNEITNLLYKPGVSDRVAEQIVNSIKNE